MRSTLFIACAIAVLAFACTTDPSSPADREPNPQPGQSVATATKAPPAQSSATTQPEASPPQSSINHPPPPTTESTLLPGSTAAPPASSQVPTPTRDPHSRLPKTPIPLFIHVAHIASTLPEYSRGDWKHWTDADRDCQDERNEVLIEESLTTVTFHTDDGCRVATGQWLAPYTNTVVTDPGKLDVDHMVPLGNAHRSGAWGWPAERKELYANHLDDTQHLIAVTASANRSKGARGPDQWKPEDQPYWCQYAIDWVTIKNTWNLTVTQPEHRALADMLATCDNPHSLIVADDNAPAAPSAPGITSTPVPPQARTSTPPPATTTYASCDAAQEAGETLIQGSQGNGRGFPKSIVPSARDGDGDGVVCER